MRQDRPSLTAHQVAVLRAAHQVLDDPKVLEDPLALDIAGTQTASRIWLGKRKLQTRFYRYLRAFVVARSRFVEEELHSAIQRGVRQYVILGAGLDTFAYRHPHSSYDVRIFEVDHPATQAWKRRQLAEAMIAIPEALTFAPVDFEKEALADQLPAVGFHTEEPSFFSWLGVTMYLSRETVLKTIRSIAACIASGSEIVFDYVVPPSSLRFSHRVVYRALKHRMRAAGEPWRSVFDPSRLVHDLKTIGFRQVTDIGPEEINRRFFNRRADKLRVSNSGHLIHARF